MGAISLMAGFSQDLDKVNDDGPSLKIVAGFSASLSTPPVFHQADMIEEHSKAHAGL
jgi:hypothetical protein